MVNCNMCIHTKTLGVCKNSLKRVHAFQKELEFGRVALVFEEKGKPEYPEKNLLEQRRESTTNSTHIWRPHGDLNPGHIGGRRALSPLRHPLLPESVHYVIHIARSQSICTGCRNVSHCQQQQSYLGLRSPGRSYSA